MSDWTAGYVAEINYTYGYYRELVPSFLDFVAKCKAKRSPDLSGPLAYCELGCGQGYSVNILAAANPNIEFYATDFNPAQIAGAQALAAAAGTPNVHFSDASFQEYIDDPSLPQFDFITLHGIYSWVSPENRKAIVDFIRKKLKVGGFVYISYNTLPGWAPAMPMRRLFVDHAGTTGGPLSSRIEKALVFSERMKEAGAAYFRDTNGIGGKLDRIKGQPRNYLAHEYFNKDWTPLYFADVAAELSGAKLDYVGSAWLFDHVNAICFTSEHAALMNEIGDPIFRETVRDYLTMNQFRRDLFARGQTSLLQSEYQADWNDLRFVLSIDKSAFPFKINGNTGEATLQPEIYGPLLEVLADGPKTLRQMLEDPKVRGLGDARLQEALKLMVGTTHLHPCLPAKGEAARAKQTKAFNAAIIKRSPWSADLNYLASPVTGGGVPLERVPQLFLYAQGEKIADAPQWAWNTLAAQNQRLVKDGKPFETPEENLAEMRLRYTEFNAKTLPILKHLGVA